MTDVVSARNWGYVFKRKLTWQFADHKRVCEAGDTFYVLSGHASGRHRRRVFADHPAGNSRS